MYSLQYRLMVKLSTPLSIEAYVPSAILIRILKRDPLAIRLNKLKFKVLHNRELLHWTRKCPMLKNVLSNSEFHYPWSSSRVVLHDLRLFFRIIYNEIMVRGLLRPQRGLKGISIVSAQFWEGFSLHSNKLLGNGLSRWLAVSASITSPSWPLYISFRFRTCLSLALVG